MAYTDRTTARRRDGDPGCCCDADEIRKMAREDAKGDTAAGGFRFFAPGAGIWVAGRKMNGITYHRFARAVCWLAVELVNHAEVVGDLVCVRLVAFLFRVDPAEVAKAINWRICVLRRNWQGGKG